VQEHDVAALDDDTLARAGRVQVGRPHRLGRSSHGRPVSAGTSRSTPRLTMPPAASTTDNSVAPLVGVRLETGTPL